MDDILIADGVAQAPKTAKRKTAKVAPKDSGEARQWGDVVPRIRELRDQGRTVPEIADELELPYLLVNQVMLQSYKMTVDTIAHFERHEARRVGAVEA